MSAKPQSPKIRIHLDLLKPQSNPEKILTKLIRWLLSSGRFIFVFVEALVLMVFIARFKLDADKAALTDAIDSQIPYIESLRSYELLIRQTQLKLSTIGTFRASYVDYPQILKKISDQTPDGVKITTLNLEKNVAKVSIKLSAHAQSNNDLITFVEGLKQEPIFSDVNITSIGFEKGSLSFSISTQASLTNTGGKSL